MRQEIYQSSPLNYLTVYPDDYREDRSYPLLIWLHGYGADKEDLSGLPQVLGAQRSLSVFPDAPLTAFTGTDQTSRAWYERGGNESPEAVCLALTALDGFIHEVMRRYRIADKQAVLLGFSQGGAVAVRYGLPRPQRLAGLASLSGSLRVPEELLPLLPPERDLPLLIAHGKRDAIVPFERSQRLAGFLEQQGYQPLFRGYAMGHQISPALVHDLRDWLRKLLPGGI